MIIFDLDGCLADCEHRRHLVEIPNCPDYFAGIDGHIYSLKGSKGHKRVSFKKLKPFCRNGKYLSVGLFLNKKNKKFSIHRLICTAFHGECPKGYECLHLDDNKLNNVPDNLKWGSRSENIRSREHNRGGWLGGLKHGNARFKLQEIQEIKSLRSQGLMYKEIAKIFSCCPTTIGEIIRGEKYKC